MIFLLPCCVVLIFPLSRGFLVSRLPTSAEVSCVLECFASLHIIVLDRFFEVTAIYGSSPASYFYYQKPNDNSKKTPFKKNLQTSGRFLEAFSRFLFRFKRWARRSTLGWESLDLTFGKHVMATPVNAGWEGCDLEKGCTHFRHIWVLFSHSKSGGVQGRTPFRANPPPPGGSCPFC